MRFVKVQSTMLIELPNPIANQFGCRIVVTPTVYKQVGSL